MLKYLMLVMLLVVTIPAGALAQEGAELPVYRINIQVDPSGHHIKGEAYIALPDIGTHDVYVGNLKVNKILVGGKQVKLKIKNGKFTVPAESHIVVEYEASFPAGGGPENLQNVGVVTNGMVSEEGVSLTGLWYPTVEDDNNLAYYRLTAVLPEGYKAVSEADTITETPAEGGTEFTFLFTHPVAQISFAAGKYVETTEKAGDVEVHAYFFKEDEDLAQTYLDHTVGYIKMYDKLIGPYPYKRYSVVENFLPTGYSFPTYTLLGQVVVRLPFIVKTSLGHEVLHQWFGDSVYVDLKKGNWSEGLTSYLADQRYDALAGKGPEHRKNLLLKYQDFVRPDNDFPLRSCF
jgi:aminopeptidase N